jgi:hypothetical protein
MLMSNETLTKYFCIGADVPTATYTVESAGMSTEHTNLCDVWDSEEHVYSCLTHARTMDIYKRSKSKYPRPIIATIRDLLYFSTEPQAALRTLPPLHSMNIFNDDHWVLSYSQVVHSLRGQNIGKGVAQFP